MRTHLIYSSLVVVSGLPSTSLIYMKKGGLETPRVTLIGLSSGSERLNHFTINLIEQRICSSILYIFPEIAIELWILFLIIFCDKIETFFIIFCNYVPHTTIFRCRGKDRNGPRCRDIICSYWVTFYYTTLLRDLTYSSS